MAGPLSLNHLSLGRNPFSYFTPGFNPNLPHPMAGLMDEPEDEEDILSAAEVPPKIFNPRAESSPEFYTAPGINDADLIDEYYRTARAPLRKQTGGEKIKSIIRNVLGAAAQPARFAGTAPDILAAGAGVLGGLRQDDLLHQAMAEKERDRELSTLSGMITQRQKAATSRASVLADTEKANKEVWDRYQESTKPIVAGNAVIGRDGKVIYEPKPKPSDYDKKQAAIGELMKTPGFDLLSPAGQARLSAILGQSYRPPASPRTAAKPNDLYVRAADLLNIINDPGSTPEAKEAAEREYKNVNKVIEKKGADIRANRPPAKGKAPGAADKKIAALNAVLARASQELAADPVKSKYKDDDKLLQARAYAILSRTNEYLNDPVVSPYREGIWEDLGNRLGVVKTQSKVANVAGAAANPHEAEDARYLELEGKSGEKGSSKKGTEGVKGIITRGAGGALIYR